MSRRRGGRGTKAPFAARARGARVLAAAAAGLGPAWLAAAGTIPLKEPAPKEPVPVSLAMAGTEHYCTGYERTFHGEWSAPNGARASGPPVLFRVGVDADGAGCYAQLNVRSPPGIAPYGLPRFRAQAQDGNAWILRYRDIVLEVDAGSGAAVRREGTDPPWHGVLLDRPPPVGNALPPPPAAQREHWYGRWRGRIWGFPFRVTLRFSRDGPDRVAGKISMFLISETFTGWFHGEMLVFHWRNRHVGLRREPGDDTLVYTDYKGRVFRFHRRG